MNDETPVERRLRDLVADFAHDDNTNARAINCGREAIRLLRSWTEDGTPWDEYNECSFCGERWKNPRVHGKDCAWTAAIALLARCEGES